MAERGRGDGIRVVLASSARTRTRAGLAMAISAPCPRGRSRGSMSNERVSQSTCAPRVLRRIIAAAVTNAWDPTAVLPSLGVGNVLGCVARTAARQQRLERGVAAGGSSNRRHACSKRALVQVDLASTLVAFALAGTPQPAGHWPRPLSPPRRLLVKPPPPPPLLTSLLRRWRELFFRVPVTMTSRRLGRVRARVPRTTGAVLAQRAVDVKLLVLELGLEVIAIAVWRVAYMESSTDMR